MVRIVSVTFVFAFALASGNDSQMADRLQAPLAPGWTVEGQARAADVKVEDFLGRQSLWLRNGTQAIRSGATFRDGTIEFDVAPMDHGDFVAIVFRRESLANHENIYLRPRTSGRYMAVQYAPRLNGSSTWQLYPEFAAKTTWPRNAWTHVRVDVRGSRLEIFVGGDKTPVVSVPRLRRESTQGAEVAFWARVNDRPAEWAAALSNVEIRPQSPSAPEPSPAPPAGFVTDWRVAGPVSGPVGPASAVPDKLVWSPIGIEESGLVNLNRLFQARAQAGRTTAFLRTTITATSAGNRLYGIGYSDDVTVFVNGAPVYSGINGWDTRIPEYQGFVDARFEGVWLPLRAGANEVVLAVSDDQRFGWGAAMAERPR